MSRSVSEISFAPEAAPSKRTVWVIFVCAALILLTLLGTNALLSGEGTMAEAVRELLAGADIFAPGGPTFAEDFSSLWFSRVRLFPAWLLGDGEFALRVNSAVAALFLLGGVMLLAEDFFNRPVVFCAAWLLVGSYGFIYWGRYAGSSMTMTAWVIWQMILLRRIGEPFSRWFLFFLLFFTGSAWWGMHFLLVMPGALVIALAGNPAKILNRRVIAAPFAALIVAVGWLTLMVWQSGTPFADYPGRIWRQIVNVFAESWSIAVFPRGSSAKWYMGAVNLSRLLLPWTLPVLIGAAGMFANWRKLAVPHRRLLIGTLLILLLTGVFPGRRWQYQLIQLPLFLIIGAADIAGGLGRALWRADGERIMKWAMMVLCSLAVAVAVTPPLWSMLYPEAPSLWMMAGMPLLGMTGLACMVFDTGPSNPVEKFCGMHGPWIGYVLAGVCFSAALFSVGIPSVTEYRSGKPFWKACRRLAADRPAGEIVMYGSSSNPVALYYLNLPKGCTAVADPAGLTAAPEASGSGSFLLIVRRRDLPSVTEVLKEKHWRVEPEPLLGEGPSVNFSAYPAEEEHRYSLMKVVRADSRAPGASGGDK